MSRVACDKLSVMEIPSSPLTPAIEALLGQHGGPLSIAGSQGEYVVMRSDVYESMLGLSNEETLAAVRCGLNDLDAGRTQPLDEAMQELRARHGS
jgi:hypothetical protein